MAAANAVVVDDSNINLDFEGSHWLTITTDNESVQNGTLSEATGPGIFEYIFIGEWLGDPFLLFLSIPLDDHAS